MFILFYLQVCMAEFQDKTVECFVGLFYNQSCNGKYESGYAHKIDTAVIIVFREITFHFKNYFLGF